MKNLIRKIIKEELEWFEPEINPAEEFLYNKFMECKLEKIGNKNWVGWTRYVDKTGRILFLDNIETGTESPELWFDYEEIYQKLEEMGLEYEEIKKLCINILYETHKRKVLTAALILVDLSELLYETHKRKVLTAENEIWRPYWILYETHKRKVLTAGVEATKFRDIV